MTDGVKIDPEAISIDDLRDRAWRIVEPQYRARLAQLVEEFDQAKPRGLADDELAPIASAVASGRVKTLLVDADREIPGRVDKSTGQIELGDLQHPDIDDLLDDLAELALNKGGQVVMVPGERMPTGTGVAAIYRY